MSNKVKREKRCWLIEVLAVVFPPFFRLIMGQKVTGAENIPQEGPCIIASNHVTAWDPIYIGARTKRSVRYMAKDTLFKNKYFARFLRWVGAFPVVRGSGGMEALDAAENFIKNEKRAVCVFIEGTRSKDGELLRPKMGVAYLAAKTQVPVIPVAIVGEGGKVPRKFGKMRINIGKPIPFEELEMDGDSGMHYRRASRIIMGRISELRDEALADMVAK